MGAALASAWGAGRMALQLEPRYEGVPAPHPTPRLAAKVAVDELILGFEQWDAPGYSLDGTIERQEVAAFGDDHERRPGDRTGEAPGQLAPVQAGHDDVGDE